MHYTSLEVLKKNKKMIKEIVKYGDKILRTVCKEYTPENNKDISNLISNLKDTLASVKKWRLGWLPHK